MHLSPSCTVLEATLIKGLYMVLGEISVFNTNMQKLIKDVVSSWCATAFIVNVHNMKMMIDDFVMGKELLTTCPLNLIVSYDGHSALECFKAS